MKRLILVAALLASSAAQAFDGSAFDAFPPLPPASNTNAALPVKTVKVTTTDSVPLQPYKNGRAVRVEVTVGGEKLWMLLDTGATLSQIPTSVADRLVAAGQARYTGTIANVTLANGSAHTAKVVSIDSFTLGRHVLHGVLALVTASGENLLGFSVIDGIGPFTVDTRSAQLVFHAP